MKEELTYELIMSEMKLLQEDNESLRKQIESLLAEISHMQEVYSIHEKQM